MRLQNRNKRLFYYANLEETEPILDDSGYDTGESDLVYGEKTPYKAIISVATTATNAYVNRRDFGNEESYQLVIICPNDNPFCSTTIFWVDDIEADEHDLHVIGITKNVNQSFVTIRKIQTRESQS